MRAAGKVVWLKALPETIHAPDGGDATTAGRRPEPDRPGRLGGNRRAARRAASRFIARRPTWRSIPKARTPEQLAARSSTGWNLPPDAERLRVNLILAIPMEVRLAVLFLLGRVSAAWPTWASTGWPGTPARSAPGRRPEPDAPPRRRWTDRVPIVGWLGLRRETPLHGRGFWIRPMLVELLAGLGLAALYWWEIDQPGLLPPRVAAAIPAALMAVLHAQYACHAGADLADAGRLADRRRREDHPRHDHRAGHAARACSRAVYPWSLLPACVLPWTQPGGVGRRSIAADLAALGRWPARLCAVPATPVAGRWDWAAGGCGAWRLMPRTWYTRHGWRRAFGCCSPACGRTGHLPICAPMG